MCAAHVPSAAVLAAAMSSTRRRLPGGARMRRGPIALEFLYADCGADCFCGCDERSVAFAQISFFWLQFHVHRESVAQIHKKSLTTGKVGQHA